VWPKVEKRTPPNRPSESQVDLDDFFYPVRDKPQTIILEARLWHFVHKYLWDIYQINLKMPAPTALKQAESAPLANDISLPVEGADEEFLLDAPGAEAVDANVLVPVEESNDMQIDEEGRPRFAPARDIVSENLRHQMLFIFLTISLGSRHQGRDTQDSYPPSPNDTSKTVMDLHLPTSG
jgi:hypothetical protein